MIPPCKTAVVRFHANRVGENEVFDPFSSVISGQMVPAATLRSPPASERLTLPEIIIHCVAALEPAVIKVNLAVTINFEYSVLVLVLREKRIASEASGRWRSHL